MESNSQKAPEGKRGSNAWDSTGEVASILNEVKKYEHTVGLSYDDLPKELCEGSHLKLGKWSLVITDNSLRNIAALTYDRVRKDLDDKEKGVTKKLTLEEELAQLDQLAFEPEEEVEVKEVEVKKMTRLEMTLAESIGGETGPSAEEQNLEEESYLAQKAAAEKVKWEVRGQRAKRLRQVKRVSRKLYGPNSACMLTLTARS